jgi:peptidoglycan hydrolase-like protein with peptidoglycan-binding domain
MRKSKWFKQFEAFRVSEFKNESRRDQMITISQSVGRGGRARRGSDDVKKIQKLLNKADTKPKLVPDGSVGTKTIRAIERFQSSFMKKPDGRIDPGGNSLRRLNAKAEATAKAAATQQTSGSWAKKYELLDRPHKESVNRRVDKFFAERTGVTGELDPKDKNLVRIWLRIRDEVMSGSVNIPLRIFLRLDGIDGSSGRRGWMDLVKVTFPRIHTKYTYGGSKMAERMLDAAEEDAAKPRRPRFVPVGEYPFKYRLRPGKPFVSKTFTATLDTSKSVDDVNALTSAVMKGNIFTKGIVHYVSPSGIWDMHMRQISVASAQMRGTQADFRFSSIIPFVHEI